MRTGIVTLGIEQVGPDAEYFGKPTDEHIDQALIHNDMFYEAFKNSPMRGIYATIGAALMELQHRRKEARDSQ